MADNQMIVINSFDKPDRELPKKSRIRFQTDRGKVFEVYMENEALVVRSMYDRIAVHPDVTNVIRVKHS